jgi:hypothetical protein
MKTAFVTRAKQTFVGVLFIVGAGFFVSSSATDEPKTGGIVLVE